MRSLYFAGVVFLFLIFGWPAKPIQAQDRSSLAIQGSVGAREDVIESVCRGGAQNSYGGSIHYYLTAKTSVGTEFLGFSHCNQAPEAQFGSDTTIRGSIHVGFILR